MKTGARFLAIFFLSVFLSTAFAANGETPGSTPPASGAVSKDCGEAIASAEGAATSASSTTGLSAAEVNQYFSFIKKNLRFPSGAEVRTMGIPFIERRRIFGSWGKVFSDEINATIASQAE